MEREPLTYAQAGVDVEAGDHAVALMRAAVEATHGPRVLGGIGGFAGLWRLAGSSGRAGAAGLPGDPVLAAASDGVGTKLLVAQALDRHDTVGIDLVAMVVDDVVVTGAEPLFVLDYLAVGRVDPERVAAIVSGVAAGCRLARCALLGGETAEHPDAMAPDAYDLAGFAVGMVERDRLLGPERVAAGDVLLGLAASGLHANGFSLARRVLARAGVGYDQRLPELGVPVGEALLTPTRIYAPHLVDLLAVGVEVHALCHVTGGGLPGNLPRCLPPGLTARVDRASWQVPSLFGLLARLGPVADEELARATNLGVGMVVVLPPGEADRAVAFLADREVPAWVMGEVVASR
ncbi:MAG TPA: phosphoribosylformylglycinamidine cyclo-ligase [Actinomycetota bacterium]|jgi:phosphoribosylformylglycinamidine cyclo-ligase|nr:phosphoribosylformylglycinamidine cyclo-ligase [Actinomycetota bacterium]